ncbi:unnamed protein product [marine sediment metagenome]|uniref:Uncharacterized protein n=1 Tax=marine sediment metagenome TaxID=412755 RepID=X1S7R3_9ZZZZ
MKDRVIEFNLSKRALTILAILLLPIKVITGNRLIRFKRLNEDTEE